MTEFALKRGTGFKVWAPKAFGVTPKKFQNAALFLQLGPPSVLIHHGNGAFQKLSSIRRNLTMEAFRFSVDGSHFENGAFRKR